MQQEINPRDLVGAKRSAPGGRPQKWFLDDRGRRLILDLYDGTPERVTLLQKQLRVPRKILKRWASELGVSRRKRHLDCEWTSEEIAYLEKNYPKKSIRELAKHLRRTYEATKFKIFKLGLRRGTDNLLHSTAVDLKEVFRCRYERIQMWIEKGWLKGSQKNGIWQFTDKQIRDFIRAHPNEIDPRKLTPEVWIWLVDLMAGGGEGIGRLDNPYEREEEGA